MKPFEWSCPHCGFAQLATEQNCIEIKEPAKVGATVHGHIAAGIVILRCLHSDCNNIKISASISEYDYSQFGIHYRSDIFNWAVYPDILVRKQPNSVPDFLANDYYEACRIRDLSPKASATLSRRCLQGMIRNFCSITDKTLYGEIEKLRKLVEEGNEPKGVTSETIDAMNAVRLVGNIGAHMKCDVNSIVDVDLGEAQSLIELIEMLFDEWYVARERRIAKLEKVKAVAAAKSK